MPDEPQLPKIFITAFHDGDYWIGVALAEDGTGLANHLSSSKIWVRHDMGLIRVNSKHDEYWTHYPNGYKLVDLVDADNDDLQRNEEYMTALRLNHEQDNERFELGG